MNSPAADRIAESNNPSSAPDNARHRKKFGGRQKSAAVPIFNGGFYRLIAAVYNGRASPFASTRQQLVGRQPENYSLRFVASKALRSEVGSIGF
ncbi:MAG: hypothetical protein AB7T86_16555 [Xanthobacteraceae bacterium]|uniref:hypothetical protein n=1 Tax=Pseudolabrys sp. TaxID=1960880 RepID=UPI003D12328F